MTILAAVALSFISTGFRRERPPVRRGHHAVGLIVTISIIAGAGAAAVAFRPRAGVADPGRQSQVVAASPRNQRTLELLASILGRCHRIIVLHPAGSGTQTDIVLWLDDTENPGTIDNAELGVITHSTVLQTLAFHHLDGLQLEPADLAAIVPRRSGRDPLRPRELTQAIVTERGFPNRWRSLEVVSTSILARGVSDLHATTLSDAARGGDLMRIELRWGPESADGADQASVLVDIGER